MGSILSRINAIAEHEGISITALEKKIGASKGVLSRALAKGSDIQSKWIQLVVENFQQYNVDWLITGRGDMTNISDHNEKTINHNLVTKPRIPLQAAAGSLTTSEDGVTILECEQLPIITALPSYDFTILAHGDSMSPEYHSGDELACLLVNSKSFIQWGRVHILDTAQGIVVKKIFDGGNDIICRSTNPTYTEFKIPKTDIYHIALVVGLVRRY